MDLYHHFKIASLENIQNAQVKISKIRTTKYSKCAIRFLCPAADKNKGFRLNLSAVALPYSITPLNDLPNRYLCRFHLRGIQIAELLQRKSGGFFRPFFQRVVFQAHVLCGRFMRSSSFGVQFR